MNRRSFTQFLGSAAALSVLPNTQGQAPLTDRKALLYRFDYLFLKQESQRGRVHGFLSAQIAVLKKHTRALGVFTAITGPRIPATLVLSAFSNFSDVEDADESLRRDDQYRDALNQIERDGGQPYDRARVLLRAAEFSPQILNLNTKAGDQRVFELRTYHSSSEQQLRLVHQCLARPQTGAFHRAAIHPVLHADTLIGPNLPNLTYLIPFPGLAEREKAWDDIANDPEWIRASQHPVAPGREVVADITLLRPTPFSQIE